MTDLLLDRLLGRLNAIKKLEVIPSIEDPTRLIVDSSALLADDDLGPRVWPLHWNDGAWHHFPSGTSGTLGEQLNGIASASSP